MSRRQVITGQSTQTQTTRRWASIEHHRELERARAARWRAKNRSTRALAKRLGISIALAREIEGGEK